MTYSERAYQYCIDIINGTIPSCQYVRQACQRQLDDMENPPDGYHFDIEKAERVCRFIEKLTHVKGIWAGKKLQMEPWQLFILTTVFGWVDDRGLRRFKTVYIEVPRKNSKSTLSSGVALYMLLADGEGGPEVYSAATTRDQAKIVWGDAQAMVNKSKPLQEHYGVKAGAHSIFSVSSNAKFTPVARDQGGNLDGLNVHCAVIDELHAHKTRDVWDVMETATGARTQPLMWAITTAGFNRAGICYEQRTYSTKILNGAIHDETFFAVIWTIEEGDDWADPATWAKANPNWGVSVNPEDIARKAKKAMEMAAAQNNFLTKHLNVWVNADIAWMDMRRWDRQGTAEGIENYYGRRAWLALDLATKTDIAALCILVDIGDGKFATFARYYLPEEAVEDGRNSQYSGWAIEEWLTTTYGATTDFGTIERDILTICDQFRVVNCVYDPWQGAYIAQRLTELNVPMAEYRHTVKNMSFAMKELEARIYDKRLIHDGNPVTTWMMSNVVAHLDAKDEIYPRKTDPSLKIDGIVALIMATGQSTVQETDSVYETRGIRTL